MRIKEHSFISMLIFLPLMLFLGILLVLGEISGSIYNYLFVGTFVAFWTSFIFALFFALDEILNSNKKKRLFFLVLVPFIYLPIYYAKYVVKKETSFGYVPALMNIILIIGLFLSVKNYTNNYMREKYINVSPSFYTYKK